LLKLGFDVRSRGSHHVFSKDRYEKNISIKKRSELLSDQLRLIEEVLKNHEE
jgi:predicted RNA binding protein YcfA (HicA-like mRNA interferase family)